MTSESPCVLVRLIAVAFCSASWALDLLDQNPGAHSKSVSVSARKEAGCQGFEQSIAYVCQSFLTSVLLPFPSYTRYLCVSLWDVAAVEITAVDNNK